MHFENVSNHKNIFMWAQTDLLLYPCRLPKSAGCTTHSFPGYETDVMREQNTAFRSRPRRVHSTVIFALHVIHCGYVVWHLVKPDVLQPEKNAHFRTTAYAVHWSNQPEWSALARQIIFPDSFTWINLLQRVYWLITATLVLSQADYYDRQCSRSWPHG
jgi:hypothetical protein